jgi:hypothetical protein
MDVEECLIQDQRMVPNKRSPMATTKDSGILDTSDQNPEAHVALLLARISRDLQVFYEPLDLSTVESACHAVEVLTNLFSALKSHSRATAALASHLQSKKTGQ